MDHAGVGIAKFVQVKEVLRREILRGTFPPGERMLSQREIADRFGIALMTARRVLLELQAAGYVVCRQGRGTFVAGAETPRNKQEGRLTIRYVLVRRKATDPAYSVILQHLFGAASGMEADLLCSEAAGASSREGAGDSLRDVFERSSDADGLILQGDVTAQEVLETRRLGIPFLVAGTPAPQFEGICDWVTFDHGAGVRLLVEHLLDLGHERIGLITGAIATEWPVFIHAVASQEMREDYCIALSRRHIPINRSLMSTVGNLIDPEDGANAAGELLTLDPPPTAIVAVTNRLAVGALGALKKNGLSVPGDVSLVTLGDLAAARDAQPPMTVAAVAQNVYAEEIVRLLVERIRGTRKIPAGVRLKPRLVVRESSGPCRHPAPAYGQR